MCEESVNDYIKDMIYRNKVVIFGFKDDISTNRAEEYFRKTFNHESLNIFLDSSDDKTSKTKIDILIKCLKLRTKSSIVPMIYLNGMYLGNYSNVESMEYRKDLNIFF